MSRGVAYQRRRAFLESQGAAKVVTGSIGLVGGVFVGVGFTYAAIACFNHVGFWWVIGGTFSFIFSWAAFAAAFGGLFMIMDGIVMWLGGR